MAEKSSHANSDVKLQEMNRFCTRPNILQYILLYKWITFDIISTAVTEELQVC